jgi:hypothetical protein
LLLSIADSFIHSVFHPLIPSLIHFEFFLPFLNSLFFLISLSLLTSYLLCLFDFHFLLYLLSSFIFVISMSLFGELCSVNVDSGSIC